MKRRLLKILLWTALVFTVLATIVVCLALFTPLPDRIATNALQRAVAKSGGTLLIQRREGTLVKGLDLYGVKFEIPGQTEFSAEHVHCRLRVVPLTWGMILLRDVRVEAPRLILTVKPREGPPGKPYKNPEWLNAWAPGTQITKGYFELRRPDDSGGTATMLWSDIETEARLSVLGQLISADLKSLSVTAPVPFPRKLDVSGKVSVTLNRTLRADVAVKTPKSSLKVKGTLDLAPGEDGFHARLALSPLYLPEAAVGWPAAPQLLVSGHANVEGNSKGIGWDASIDAEGLGPVKSEGRAEFQAKRIAVSGDARTPGAALSPFWKTPPGKEAVVSAKARWRVLVTEGSPPSWSAEGELGESRVWGFSLERASFKASGTPTIGEASGSVVSPSTGPMTCSASWDLGRSSVEAKVSGEQVPLPELLKQLGLDVALPAPLAIPPGSWNVHQADLASDAEGIKIRSALDDPTGTSWEIALGPLREGGPLTVDAKATGLDPEKWGLPYQGRLQAGASLRGPSLNDAALDLDVGASRWAGADIEPFKARILLQEKGFLFDPLTVKTSMGTASFQGSIGRDGSLEGKAELAVPDLTRLKPFLKEQCPAGALEFSGKLGGSIQKPAVDGSALLKGASYSSISATKLAVTGRWETGGRGTDLRADWEDLKTGETALGVGSLDLQGGLEDATLHLLTDLGSEDRHLKATAKGSLGINRADLTLTGIALELGRFDLEQAGEARLALSPQAVEWSDLTMKQYKSRVSLSGRISLEGPMAKAPISGALHAYHLPVKLLPIPPTAGQVGGHINADLTWSGTMSDPVIGGQAKLDNGYYLLPNSDLAITPINATLVAQKDSLLLTEASATTPEGGKASATGFMHFEGFLPTEYSVTATGKAFPFVIGRDMEGATDFVVTLKGTPEEPRLEGSATLVKGRIQLPETSHQQPLPPTIKFKNAPPGSPLAREAEGESLKVGLLRGAIQIDAGQDLWVTNRSLLAELSGKITVRFTEKGPAIGGALTLDSGRYLFQGKKFEIQVSKIVFNGTTELNPYLDLNAKYAAGDTDVFVHIKGPADKPELSLTSSPPMPEGDILSVLLFGRRQSELDSSQSQSWSMAALALAGQYQAAPLLSSIQDKLGLETLEVATAAEGGTEVGFSKHLGDRVVVEYRQSFGSVPEQRVNLRYRVNRHVSLQADTSSLGRSGADVFWEQVY